MMRSGTLLFVIAVGSLCTALFLQWVASPFTFAVPVFLPSFAVFTVVIWLWFLPFSWRLWYAGVTGFILDSTALPPFGTMLLFFLFLSVAAEGLKFILASRDSNVAQAVSVTVFCGMVIGVLPLARAAAGYLYFLGS